MKIRTFFSIALFVCLLFSSQAVYAQSSQPIIADHTTIDIHAIPQSAIEQAKRQSQTAASVSISRDSGQLLIEVGAGKGNGRLLLIGFDHEHQTAIRRGENSGRTLEEANVVRSIRKIGDWQGAALRLNETFPEGQEVAVVLQAPDGKIVGAAKP